MIIDFFPNSSRSNMERKSICDIITEVENSDYSKFGFDYFDNIKFGVGYGGYKYDGRYANTVKKMIDFYKLKKGDTILELGCAKGYILVEFFKLCMNVVGVDVSEYAITNSHPEIKKFLICSNSTKLSFEDKQLDFVFSKEMLPHVNEEEAKSIITECMRVSKKGIFFEIQVAETKEEEELMYKWDITHKLVKSSVWWDKFLKSIKYTGDVHYKRLFD